MQPKIFQPMIIEASDPPDELLDLNSFLRFQGIHPRAILNLIPVQEIQEEKILLRGGEAVQSPFISSLLHSATELGFPIATIGNKLEKQVEQYFKRGDPLRACSLDNWGAAALVSFGRRSLYRRMPSLAEAKGSSLNILFSPGHAQ